MKRRRAPGEGALFQTANGRWRGRLELGYVDGVRARRWVSGRTQAEARTKLQALQAQQRAGRLATEPGRLTVAQYLAWWLTTIAAPTVRPRTLQRYDELLRMHALPTLGPKLLARVTAADVQALLSRTLATRAPATVVQLRAVLRRAWHVAERWDYVPRNVVALTEPPRRAHVEQAHLTAAQLGPFRAAIRGDRLEALYLLALATGMRQGELLALRWADVDWAAGTLTVNATLQREGGTWERREPKTPQSRRVVYLLPTVISALRAHSAREKATRLREGLGWSDTSLLFTGARGGALHGTTVTRQFQRLLQAAGLPRLRFHDLRHSTGTLYHEMGVDIRTRMAALGHTTMPQSLDYTHAPASLLQDAAARMERLLAAARPGEVEGG